MSRLQQDFTMELPFEYDDGGRAAAGFKGKCGDCGTRAAAIALGMDYREVYNELNDIRKEFLKKCRTASTRKRYEDSVRNGTATDVMEEFMKRHGWTWVAKMRIGSGCTQHLYDMPRSGRYVCRVAKHYCAVVDGVIRDLFHDDGECCVYGYWCKMPVVERRSTECECWYITKTDMHGNILIWKGGTSFAMHIPMACAFATEQDALDAMGVLGLKDCKVRKCRVAVKWN